MRVRHLVGEVKTIRSDTGWKYDDIPPRHSGVYPKSKPLRRPWQWRSVVAGSEQREYIFLTQVNPDFDNWKAWLVAPGEPLGSIVCRFEYHGSHPGFHAHAHCERGGLEVGPTSINDLVRVPKAQKGAAIVALSPDRFWEQARRRFRINFPAGQLF
jgi:hypothetical protein